MLSIFFNCFYVRPATLALDDRTHCCAYQASGSEANRGEPRRIPCGTFDSTQTEYFTSNNACYSMCFIHFQYKTMCVPLLAQDNSVRARPTYFFHAGRTTRCTHGSCIAPQHMHKHADKIKSHSHMFEKPALIILPFKTLVFVHSSSVPKYFFTCSAHLLKDLVVDPKISQFL